ncbi:MAG TPA: transcription initiation factor IIB [Nitrososphaeraceae archaeon]|nr:transcription initiation factor IIB [Nitrososphaeraceae archaeon]
MCGKGKSIITDLESGELICSDCGMVISDNIQENNRSERRAFNIMELNDRSRTGAPTTLARHDMGLATVIGNGDKDASGTKINVAMRSTMNRLRTWDFRTQHQASNDRNLEQAFTELNILKDKLGLSDAAVQKTAYIYRKLQKRGYVRGRSILSVLAAAIYIACREIGISRTIKDIAAISNIRRKELARIYRLLVFELDIKIPMLDPMKCIGKVANKANLNEKIVRQAMNIMKDLNNREISAGKNPMVLAATVLYLSCFKSGQNITQDDISHAAGITGVTLRNRLNDLNNKFS